MITPLAWIRKQKRGADGNRKNQPDQRLALTAHTGQRVNAHTAGVDD